MKIDNKDPIISKVDYLESMLLSSENIDLDEIKKQLNNESEVTNSNLTQDHFNNTISDMDNLINQLRLTSQLAKKYKEETKFKQDIQNQENNIENSNNLNIVNESNNLTEINFTDTNTNANEETAHTNNNYKTEVIAENEENEENDENDENLEESDAKMLEYYNQILLNKYKMEIKDNEFILKDNYLDNNDENKDEEEDIDKENNNDKEDNEDLDDYEVETYEGIRSMNILNNMESLLEQLNNDIKIAEDLSNGINFLENDNNDNIDIANK